MKAYIVTSGCYSDYEIRGVFSSMEGAEAYKNAINDAQVETYDMDTITHYNSLDVGWILLIFNSDLEYEKIDGFSCRHYTNTFNDFDNTNFFVNKQYSKPTRATCSISLTRGYKGGLYTEEEIKEKMLKIVYDIKAESLALLSEGYTWYEVEKIIEDHYC